MTIVVPEEDFISMLEGKLNAISAFMAGKLKVKGDMSLAMKLQALVGQRIGGVKQWLMQDH